MHWLLVFSHIVFSDLFAITRVTLVTLLTGIHWRAEQAIPHNWLSSWATSSPGINWNGANSEVRCIDVLLGFIPLVRNYFRHLKPLLSEG